MLTLPCVYRDLLMLTSGKHVLKLLVAEIISAQDAIIINNFIT